MFGIEKALAASEKFRKSCVHKGFAIICISVYSGCALGAHSEVKGFVTIQSAVVTKSFFGGRRRWNGGAIITIKLELLRYLPCSVYECL